MRKGLDCKELFVKLAAFVLIVGMLAANPGVRALAAPAHVLDRSSLELSSKHALLIRLDDGEVLLDIRSGERMYPASMTKIMTALVVIERLPDLNTQVLLGEDMFDYIAAANASTAGFGQGERVKAIDLLHGILLSSGAECSIGLAEHIAGSEATFVELMNRRAAELGMSGTHFTNVCGLHDSNHYSTARDMALLLETAMKNDTFYRVFTTQEYMAEATNLHPDGLRLGSTIFGRISTSKFTGGGLLGGKTGFTFAAGQCLASIAEKDGATYLLVTAGAQPTDYRSQILHIEDAFAVYNALGRQEYAEAIDVSGF